MMSEWKMAPLVASLEMQNAGWREADRQGLDLESVEMQPIYQAMLAEAPQPQKEPVVWGAPKTVRQLIGQLETLDPDLETVALYRLPDGLGEVSGKVKQGHISTSYERMEGIWLGPYKGSGRKVLAFWTKLDPREVPDGEPLTQPPALGGEPEVVGYQCRQSAQEMFFLHEYPHYWQHLPLIRLEDHLARMAAVKTENSVLQKQLGDRGEDISAYASNGEKLQAEIDYLKLELRGVERAKADLAELLGCADEPRWKWLLSGAQDLIAERNSLKALIDQVRAIAEDRAKGYASREHGGVLNGRCMDKVCALFETAPAAKDGAQ
jgi:hypothetical protein